MTTPKRPAVVRVDAVVRALRKAHDAPCIGLTDTQLEWLRHGLKEAVTIVKRIAKKRLARPAQRKGKR